MNDDICVNCQRYKRMCTCVTPDPLVKALNDSASEMMIEIAECIERLVKAREKCWNLRYKPELRSEAVAQENEERASLRDLGVPIEPRDE